MTPTVFIVDDDAAMRAALRQLLEIAGLRVEVYADGPAFLAACEEDRAGCVLLDMAMPGMNGHEVQAALSERGLQIPVIFLTGHGDVSMAVRTVQAGAMDFLMKPVQGAALLERVHRALTLDEEHRRTQTFARDIRQCYGRLTPREREVMLLLVAGLSNKEVARQLVLSPRTVEVHRSHIMHKMGVANVAELAKVATHCQP